MHFLIPRSISPQLHRRSRSEKTFGPTTAPISSTQPRSLEYIADQSLPAHDASTDCSPLAHRDVEGRGSHHDVSSHSPHNLNASSSRDTSEVLSAVTARLQALEAQNEALKDKNSSLLIEAEIREEDISYFQVGLASTRVRVRHQQTSLHADEEKFEGLDRQLKQSQKLIELITEVNPAVHALTRTAPMTEDEEDAIVDHVRKASRRPQSGWQRIVNAVIGPRPSGDYLSEILTTLELRRELKDSRKFAKFWERKAKDTGVSITPSPSNVCGPVEGDDTDRGSAVDAFLERGRIGELGLRQRAFIETQIPLKSKNSEPVDDPCTPPEENGATVSKPTRRILGVIDFNRRVKLPQTPTFTVDKVPSAKGLGKRREVAVVGDPKTLRNPITQTSPVTSVPPLLISPGHVVDQSTIETASGHAITSEESPCLNVDHTMLSRERLCAAFSTGSLRSLWTIQEDREDSIMAGADSSMAFRYNMEADDSIFDTSDTSLFPNSQSFAARKSRLIEMFTSPPRSTSNSFPIPIIYQSLSSELTSYTGPETPSKQPHSIPFSALPFSPNVKRCAPSKIPTPKTPSYHSFLLLEARTDDLSNNRLGL